MKENPDTKRGSGWHGLDPGPRRALASRILAVLEHHGVSYGVLRDPSRLFDEGRGDLDIWVPAKSIQSAIGLIEGVAEDAGWWLLKRVRRPYVGTLYLYRPGPPASALTVDTFPAIRWLVADLLSETLLATSRVRKANAWIVDPRVSALASCLHHLAWNGRVASRYLEAYLRVDAGDDLPYSRLVHQIANDPNPQWRRRRRRLLMSAVATGVIAHPVRAGYQALCTVAALARSSPGRWVAFEGPESAQYMVAIDRRLHEEHFLVGRWGSVGRIPKGAIARTGWYTRNVLMKRRLGAIVLSAGDPGGLSPDARVWAARSGWEAQGKDDAGETARGKSIEDLCQYVITWLASECRIQTSESRHTNGIIVGVVGSEESAGSFFAQQLESEASLQPAVLYQRTHGGLRQITQRVCADTTKSEQGRGSATHRSQISLVRLARCWLDTQLGFATALLRLRRAGFVVLVEHSFFDMVVDLTRYGSRIPRWVLELATWASFKPRLLLNLSLRSSEVMEGVTELSLENMERQTIALRSMDTRNLDANGRVDLLGRAMDVIKSARGAA